MHIVLVDPGRVIRKTVSEMPAPSGSSAIALGDPTAALPPASDRVPGDPPT